MTPEQYARIELIFNAAAELPRQERAEYLDAHAGDTEIRRIVEKMLAEDEDLRDDDALSGGCGAAELLNAAVRAGASYSALHPERIGRYRIIRRLGSGGMGVVYEAQQESPRRRVALKMMRTAFMSKQLLRRFEVEAHVLGQLHHPGIAQIYESGLAEEAALGEGAQPFFAMELIEGQGLREYVKSNDCSIRDRLALVIQVAEAVQHAHQKGVIHRDLKPDNILVDETGGGAQPKVLDFGVARAVDSDTRITTMQTDAGQIIGTLAYMSPEQVLGQPELIDTRSDVYSLGAIAYELLTDALPLDVTKSSVPAALRMIQETEPRRLSELNVRLRGDLETIIAKAMEKDRGRRYQSAAEFAADIRRYLNDEPIVARPSSALYQFGKFAKRNRTLVGSAAALFVCVTVGMIVASWLAIDAAAARDEAWTDSQKLREVNAFVLGMLAEANPANNTMPREMTVADMLDVAARRVENTFYEAPEIEAEIRATLGQAYHELGRFQDAIGHLKAALDMQRTICDDDDLNLAGTMHLLGNAMIDGGDHAGARPLLEGALAIRRAQLGEQHRDVVTSLGALGHLHFVEGKYEDADRLLEQALNMAHAVMPDDYLALVDLYEKRGLLAWQRGEAEQAQAQFRAAVDQFEDRPEAQLHSRYVKALNNLAVVLRFAGEVDTAEAMYVQTLETAKRIYGEEHPFIATTLNNIGWLHQSKGDFNAAVPLVREAMEMRRRLLGPEHADVSAVMHNLAALLGDLGDLEQALPLMRESLAIRRRALGPKHPDIVPALHTLAELLEQSGELDEPLELLHEAAEIDEASYGGDHPHVSSSLELVAKLHRARQEPADAERTLRRALAIRVAALGVAHKKSVRTNLILADWLVEFGRHAEAEELLLEQFEALRDGEAALQENAAARLVELYEELERPEEATAWRAKVSQQ